MQRSGKLREDADSLTNATKARAGEVKRVSLLEGERTESDRAEERLVRGRWYFNRDALHEWCCMAARKYLRVARAADTTLSAS